MERAVIEHMNAYVIRKYRETDLESLFALMLEEGEDWSEYFETPGRERFVQAIKSSITYIVCDQEQVVGFIRCRPDDGLGIYVYDLLVRQSHRGRQLGRRLMERVLLDYPDQPVFVMSDVDPYYEKLGYVREGSIFRVLPSAAEKEEHRDLTQEG